MLTHINIPSVAAVGLVAMGAMLTAGCDIEARMDSVNGSFDRTVQVAGPVDLTVTNGAGDITVTPGTDGTVHVVGRIRAHDWMMSDLSATEKVKRLEAAPPITQSGNEVRIGEIADDALRRNLRIDYDIQVPANTTVHSRTGSGDQAIGAVQGPVDVKAGSGDVHVGPTSSSVRATTGSGDSRLREITGDVVATAGSGDIQAERLVGGLRARTGSGDIEIDGEPTRDWNVDAASGDVTLRLPGNAHFTLDATSSSGHVRTTHPIDESGSRGRRQLRGAVRGGGARIDISTASGSIDID